VQSFELRSYICIPYELRLAWDDGDDERAAKRNINDARAERKIEARERPIRICIPARSRYNDQLISTNSAARS
jgi:hypothetical protein